MLSTLFHSFTGQSFASLSPPASLTRLRPPVKCRALPWGRPEPFVSFSVRAVQ